MLPPILILRWLRFSLSSFLIALTIVCVWLGWTVEMVRKRKDALPVIIASGGIPSEFADQTIEVITGWAVQKWEVALNRSGNAGEPGAFRLLLGDRPVRSIYFNHAVTPEELAQCDVFPEATVASFVQWKTQANAMPAQARPNSPNAVASKAQQ